MVGYIYCMSAPVYCASAVFFWLLWSRGAVRRLGHYMPDVFSSLFIHFPSAIKFQNQVDCSVYHYSQLNTEWSIGVKRWSSVTLTSTVHWGVCYLCKDTQVWYLFKHDGNQKIDNRRYFCTLKVKSEGRKGKTGITKKKKQLRSRWLKAQTIIQSIFRYM